MVYAREIDIMQGPHVHFIVYVYYAFTLQEVEEVVIDIAHTSPQVTPEPLYSLVVGASSTESTASVRASADAHQ